MPRAINSPVDLRGIDKERQPSQSALYLHLKFFIWLSTIASCYPSKVVRVDSARHSHYPQFKGHENMPGARFVG